MSLFNFAIKPEHYKQPILSSTVTGQCLLVLAAVLVVPAALAASTDPVSSSTITVASRLNAYNNQPNLLNSSNNQINNHLNDESFRANYPVMAQGSTPISINQGLFATPNLVSSDLSVFSFGQSGLNKSAFGSQYTQPKPVVSELKLPDLGSGGGRFIEANQHKAIGEWSLQQLARSTPLLNDPWSQQQLERMAWQINAQARTQAPLALLLINNTSINAFAIPGGLMGIHAGTITESSSMDEVASVIAHEVAHLSQRHYEHREEAGRKALLLQIGGLLAAIAASAADGDAAAAVLMGSQTAAMNSQMAFSRSNEREADRIGMQLMAKSGYDPRAMPKFFATLNQKTQLNMSKDAYLPSFIMTHPLSSERLSEAQSRANSYPPVALSEQRDKLVFDLLKWRLKVLTNQVNEGDLLVAASKSKGAEMALAYWYASHNRYQDAAQRLRQLKNSKPSHVTAYADQMAFDILLAITEGQTAGMQGKWQITEQVLLPYYKLYPERRDIKLVLTEAWLNLGKYNEVISALKPTITNRPYDTEALFRIQRAYELMASTEGQGSQELANISAINALRYRAQGELWRGRYEDALVSLQQAKNVLEASQKNRASTFNTSSLLANINSEIAQVTAAKEFRP
ncbi:M48 family metalloprotease [Psychrobacter lutiphocae]|uniref:M48 family metalloprotease n=1 Tax=Psychrobacter lutiphocae TaxID=540500 RepID=UPI00036593E3|nr:M48 family metalloprotease [Psychrobacter lutiphocae]